MASERTRETWQLRKPAVGGAAGLVASQHYFASETGADVLRRGGNAVDAAIAAGFAIATVEPWMSGLGGGGYMLVYLAAEDRSYTVEFPMVAPRRLDPADYPLTGGRRLGDLFGWPTVLGDRNLLGYPAIALPGYVAGMGLAHERFARLPWTELLAPAIASAKAGMPVDWYATLLISTGARDLMHFDESRRVYLPDRMPPVVDWDGRMPRLKLGRLAETLERLAGAGAGDFYQGEIAASLLADLGAGGNRLAADDLAQYQAAITAAEQYSYRDATLWGPPSLTAGGTLRHALALLAERWRPTARPDAEAYLAYAAALSDAFAFRLANLGDTGEGKAPSCTTHLSVVDRHGNMVALTQTLLSLFGSKVVLPGTGITMNNAIMWFDPTPGRPNSIRPGRRPLSNMTPTLLRRADGSRTALGGSGGRRILPAVMQLVSFLTDYRLGLDVAIHTPRIDASGGETVAFDTALPADIQAALAARFATDGRPHGVYPISYACPNAVTWLRSGRQEGAAYVASPWAYVAAA
ncbi:MAG: gamma-glutamyltransferase [Alphaproteobacteria bacterium]|nr:gamma-glutamyltransferase [Alphaproteobacteria bacterium]